MNKCNLQTEPIFIHNRNYGTGYLNLKINALVAGGVNPAVNVFGIIFVSDAGDIFVGANQVKNDIVANVYGGAGIYLATNSENPSDIRLDYWGDVTNNSTSLLSAGIAL